MVTMEMANLRGTINCKTVPNPPVGTSTSTDIIKKTSEKESRRILPAMPKASMAPPTGQNRKHYQWEKMKNNMKPKEQLVKCTPANLQQPYVKAKVNGYGRNLLYDTGASRTCMTMNTFWNVFPNGTPRKSRTNSISDELYDAEGKSLGCNGVYEMDFEVYGRKIKHPVRVLQHVTEDIIGIDFINTHHLWYDPVYKEVFLTKQTTQQNFRSCQKHTFHACLK